MSTKPQVACCEVIEDPRGAWRHGRDCSLSPLALALFDLAEPSRAEAASRRMSELRQSGECSVHPGEPDFGCFPCSEMADNKWKERAV